MVERTIRSRYAAVVEWVDVCRATDSMNPIVFDVEGFGVDCELSERGDERGVGKGVRGREYDRRMEQHRLRDWAVGWSHVVELWSFLSASVNGVSTT